MRGQRARCLLSLLLVGATAGIVACGGDLQVDANGAPGYSGQEREVDRSPFELAAPSTTEGPTTIPGGPRRPSGGQPGQGESGQGESGQIDEVVATTTTTTTTLPETVPPPVSGDLVCSSFFVVAGAVREGQNMTWWNNEQPGSVDYAAVRQVLVDGLRRAEATLAFGLPDQRVTDVPTALLRRIRSTAAFAEGTTSFEDGPALLYPLVGAPPEAGEPIGWPQIEAEIAGSCPELLVALSGRPTLT